jgi:N-acetyl-gamma-glutamyl-phosphate reductase
MIRVGIVGATGYAGAELVRILSSHPNIEITMLVSRQYAGVSFDTVYPAFKGIFNQICQELNTEKICEETDVVFLALPHKIPMAIVPELLAAGKKVIDLSADFRLKDADVYEKHYQPHAAKELLAKAVYGLCEVFSNQIKTADLIGNPGCYPTSILLPLTPLIQNNLIDAHSIIADAKSGVSGAGRTPSVGIHICEVGESFKSYKVAEHRHNPEIDEVLSTVSGNEVHITFVPHLVPMSRGMQSTIYCGLSKGIDEKDISNCLNTFYKESNFVRILADDQIPETRFVRGTNYCDIGFRIDKKQNRLIIMSVIDNLVKGAAGQAVQNMNLMLGFDEAAGLNDKPYPV